MELTPFTACLMYYGVQTKGSKSWWGGRCGVSLYRIYSLHYTYLPSPSLLSLIRSTDCATRAWCLSEHPIIDLTAKEMSMNRAEHPIASDMSCDQLRHSRSTRLIMPRGLDHTPSFITQQFMLDMRDVRSQCVTWFRSQMSKIWQDVCTLHV